MKSTHMKCNCENSAQQSNWNIIMRRVCVGLVVRRPEWKETTNKNKLTWLFFYGFRRKRKSWLIIDTIIIRSVRGSKNFILRFDYQLIAEVTSCFGMSFCFYSDDVKYHKELFTIENLCTYIEHILIRNNR